MWASEGLSSRPLSVRAGVRHGRLIYAVDLASSDSAADRTLSSDVRSDLSREGGRASSPLGLTLHAAPLASAAPASNRPYLPPRSHSQHRAGAPVAHRRLTFWPRQDQVGEQSGHVVVRHLGRGARRASAIVADDLRRLQPHLDARLHEQLAVEVRGVEPTATRAHQRATGAHARRPSARAERAVVGWRLAAHSLGS